MTETVPALSRWLSMAKNTSRHVLVPPLVLALVTACSNEDGEDGDIGPPLPPEMLEAAALDGGAHLTWVDASDDETEFAIRRMDVMAGGDYETVGTVPFDTTSYHDAPLTPGTTYMFVVAAVNQAGSSDSNEVELTTP